MDGPQPPKEKRPPQKTPVKKGEETEAQLRFPLPFLEKLLPNADSGDILILLILLLLLAEGNEDSSTVTLTLMIFLFLQ